MSIPRDADRPSGCTRKVARLPLSAPPAGHFRTDSKGPARHGSPSGRVRPPHWSAGPEIAKSGNGSRASPSEAADINRSVQRKTVGP